MNINLKVLLYRTINEFEGITKEELVKVCSITTESLEKYIEEGKNAGEIYGDEIYGLTEKGLKTLEPYKVDNAIILAAGFGSRFVPMTYETPKGLLKVFGKPMLENQIEQLIEKGIKEIIIVVGYLKEKFDYLIDKYGVKLVYNPEYNTKNNLASLYVALKYLKNSYILVADNWIENNMFNSYEPVSWFSCLYFDGPTAEWCVATDKNDKFERIDIGGADSWTIVGPSFFTKEFSKKFKEYVEEYYSKPGTEDYYWEHILREQLLSLPPMYKNEQQGNMHEFECLEELREYDPSYINHTNSQIIETIAKCFNISEGEIYDIYPLKEGVTNNSFHFTVNEKEYVFRVPGVGTDKQIDRKNEKYIYECIGSLDISDEVVYFNADSGVKITKFYPDVRTADPFSDKELGQCMKQLRKIHEKEITVDHYFNIDDMIHSYTSLAEEIDAIRFSDIDEVKIKMEKLLKFRDELNIPEILCHGDFAHINVLMLNDGSARIIDWEFGGMADPIMDISMYAIFAQFDKERIDLSLRLYLDREPFEEEWARLYLYVALGGFLWCMWSEYKQALGQEFGEYPLIMYRYMKDYYKLLESEGFLN